MTNGTNQGLKTMLYSVSDLEAAKKIFTALLGQEPQADSSYYVGYDVGDQHIGFTPGEGPHGTGAAVAYWHVSDIEAKLEEVTAAGASLKDPVRNVSGTRRVATVTDPDGNVLGLLQD